MTRTPEITEAKMSVPELSATDVAFGSIGHMPAYKDLPKAFQDWQYNPYCKAISSWFYRGAQAASNGIVLDGVTYAVRDGVDAHRALAAIRAVLGSFQPKHEHKIAACGYMLSQWFEAQS